MPVTKVTVIDLCDGFDIKIIKDGAENYYHFDQEDSRERLVEVFNMLGVECWYEESY